MSAKALRDAVARSDTLAPAVHRHVGVVQGWMAQSVACNARHRVEPRLCRWLLTCADYVETNALPLTQEFIAAVLGVQRTSVSEAAASLQDKGIIRVLRGKVTILDIEALKQRSCECYAATRELIHFTLGSPSEGRVIDDGSPAGTWPGAGARLGRPAARSSRTGAEIQRAHDARMGFLQ
jgi:hypothetical protein